MGKGYVYRCPKCGHEEELLSGVGFMSPVEADMERESILTGIYGPKAQAALVAHPEAPVSVQRAVYQCGACGKLESRLAVTVKAPVRVPILQRCDCGATMHRIRSGKDILCPACRCSVGLKVNFQGKNCVAFVLLIPPKTGQFPQTLKY